MTAKQFRAALDALGLNHSTAPHVLGVGQRSIIRYANNQAAVPPVIAKLLTMMIKHGVPKD